jgi:hypothetical protein
VAYRLEEIIGVKGAMVGGVFHINVPRNDIHVKMMGVDVPGNMGMNTPLNFQIEGKKAAVNGDFMLLADEINRSLKPFERTGLRWPLSTTTCWTKNRGYSLCISGPTTTR